VVARQAGYKTLEINASDDRSAATVSTRIKNAIEAGSGLASEGKPTCVIIDEIDGASGGGDTVRNDYIARIHANMQSFVRSLIKLIQDVPARRKSEYTATGEVGLTPSQFAGETITKTDHLHLQ
jgi:chromosome transmission fidelity protein 18